MSISLKKKYAMIVLAVLLCVSTMQMPAWARSDKGQIDGFSGTKGIEEAYYLTNDQNNWDLEVQAGQEVRIALTADMFNWENGRTPLDDEAVTIQDLKRSRVTVRTQSRAGSKVLDYVQLNTDRFGEPIFTAPGIALKTDKTTYISLVFAKDNVITKDAEFEYDVYLTAGGERDEYYRMTLAGRVIPSTLEVTEDMDYINISDGSTAIAESYVPNVKVDIGEGITIQKHMNQNNRYYGIAKIIDSMGILREDYPEVYPSIAAVYKLHTINMRYPNQGVRIDISVHKTTLKLVKYFVYNEELQLLGMTDELLPYSDIYILAKEELPSTMNAETYESQLVNPPTRIPAS